MFYTITYICFTKWAADMLIVYVVWYNIPAKLCDIFIEICIKLGCLYIFKVCWKHMILNMLTQFWSKPEAFVSDLRDMSLVMS